MAVDFVHSFKFDPRYGYGLEELLKVGVPEEPGDFAEFWKRTWEENAGVPLKLASREVEGTQRVRVFEVEFDSLGGARVGGWVTIPRKGEVVGGIVEGHGYGGRAEPELDTADWVGEGVAGIFPCARGMGRSKMEGIAGESKKHVLCGIGSRETYVHRGCVCDVWSAASALVEMVPGAGRRMGYCGTSFGGGIGALALAWDRRFERAFLEVPSFGNYPLRVGMECTGSWEAVRGYWKEHPEVLEVLGYFDAATAARRITAPVLGACALFDPSVSPPGQFAVFNAIRSEKELFVREAGHFNWPGNAAEQERLKGRVRAWFGG